MKEKALVIGNGGWGTALALTLLRNGFQVTIWGPFAEEMEELRKHKMNRSYLPGIPLPQNLICTADRTAAAEDASLIVLAVPSRYYEDVARSFRGRFATGTRFVSVSKGLSETNFRRMSQLAEDALETGPVTALSGPSHAEEVARRIPTAVVAACADIQAAAQIQQDFSNREFRVYTSDDIIGTELGGALKNVIAVAVGASDGLGFGDNTRAALITRGLAEITRLGTALGARAETFAGLSGLGDLIVTCTSRHSRNRGVGERLGKGETIADIQSSMKQVAEGVWNATLVAQLAARQKIEMPITAEVHAIVTGRKSPKDAVQTLMERSPKPE